MNTKQVCYNFTRGIKTNCQDGCDGHNSGHNVFYEGDILYSYGYHYPLAIRVSVNKYLVNCSGYSNSTARHTNHFYDAVSYSDCIQVPTSAMQAWKNGDFTQFQIEGVAYWNRERLNATDKITRARLDHTRARWQSEIDSAQDNIKTIKAMKSDSAPKPKANPFGAVAMVAKMGELLTDTQTQANDWKKRMLKAGISGLIMPDDWDNLSEDEKTTRLDKVIKEMGK